MFGRRIISAALAVGASAALALGSSGVARASDITGVSDLLIVTGTAVINGDGALGTTAGSCADAPDLLGGETVAHVDASGGCGAFTFSSSACAGVSQSVPPSLSEIGTCSATASGNFKNIICGTGSASGSVTITGNESATATFNIIFVGTIGVLRGGSTDTSGDEAGESDDQLVGVVQLGPAQGGGPLPDGPPDCTSAFTITSATVAFDLPVTLPNPTPSPF